MKRLGIIGKPLAHSFSKRYFTEKFFRESIAGYNFEQYELQSIEDFPSLIRCNTELQGLTVTIPYKTVIIPYLDEIDKTAKEIGAVNVLRIHSSEKSSFIKGYNTDYIGFIKTLPTEDWKKMKHAIVLGSGGASLAVQYVMNIFQIPYVVVSRNKEEGAHQCNITYLELTEELVKSSSLIINTTPLGMYPNIESKPAFPFHFLSDKHTLIDLVYNPTVTSFMKEGMTRGATVYNGETMLYAQAEEAWKLFSNDEIFSQINT